MPIPVRNIYHILTYAWNKLEERDKVMVDIDGYTTIPELFAKVLLKGTRKILKSGLDKNYISHDEEVSGVKGKLLLNDTIKRVLHKKQLSLCQTESYSAEILTNQILLTTLQRLSHLDSLDTPLKQQSHLLGKMFPFMPLRDLNYRHFQQVHLHRNNRTYGLLMDVCRLIFEQMFPSEQSGHWVFKDFQNDPVKMRLVFQQFLKKYYQVHRPDFSVAGETIVWGFEAQNDESQQLLPQMHTDITMLSRSAKIIIDAKYYSQTVLSHHGKAIFHPGHMYQLFSYLLNQENSDPITRAAAGILIYPTIDRELNIEYTYRSHPIFIKTINLNWEWRKIEERLFSIVDEVETAIQKKEFL